LLYRINVVRIDVPPLRARGNDTLLLAQAFLKEAASATSRDVTGISPEAAEKLLAYDWPGNVREVQNAMQRAAALTQYEHIVVDDLPEKVKNHHSTRLSFDTDDLSSLLTLEELEKRYVLGVLQAVGGNKTAAARILGFDRRTLYRKLERFDVSEDFPLSTLSQPSWPV
jgi:two-component system response regulator HydG